ncbi:hypothetical protein [Terrisporobacter sp.]|uniref:hypothetical protein n=1 Tax=Terrisporobacter sp. TaxID=1965305 RepID=UPI00262A99AD|nr:hypothetical protein [Terrisporobacter sp.]
MVGLEKEILYLVSRVRYVTETQVGKVFSNKKRNGKRTLKKTLRKMCNDYTLRKIPCNINYTNFKDNTYVYYLNGSSVIKGKNLTKMLIGSEINIRFNNSGYETIRFYRNAKVGDQKYDIFIEYINNNKVRLQALIDIDLDGNISTSKYDDLKNDIENSTIPFFMIPKVIIISSDEQRCIGSNEQSNIYFLDTSLHKLFNYL